MRVAYYMSSNFSHFSELLPYYQVFGGLVYSPFPELGAFHLKKYPEIPITFDLKAFREYRPEVVLYATVQLIRGPWKNVQIFHGTSDKPFYFEDEYRAIMEGFDLCLCYGERQKEKFKRHGISIKSKVIGCAKVESDITVAEELFPEQLPTVLYAPSWQIYSSLARFAEAVGALTQDYNVLVKPHAATGQADCIGFPFLQRLAKKQGPRLRVVQTDSIIHLMKAADIFLGDIGGSIYEFLYFDKPLLALNPNPDFFSKSDDLLGPTYLWNYVDVVDTPEELASAIAHTLRTDPRKADRKKVLDYSFHTEVGSTALERGVRAIEQLVAEGSLPA